MQSNFAEGRGKNKLCTLFGDKPRLPLFRFPALIRAYIGSSRKKSGSALFMTPRSDVDDVDATGSTALSWAVRYHDHDSVQELLLCGSNPCHKDSYGQNPLHIATRTGDVALVNLLLAARPDVNSKDRNGRIALHLASQQREGVRLIDLLVAHGASLESQDDHGWRPLHYSVYSNRPANMHLLLEKGANINAISKYGATSLMLGVLYKSHEAVRVLLREETLEFRGKDNDGWSVLNYAALFGDMETICILQSSPKMKTVDLDGSPALFLARWRRDENETGSLWRGRVTDEDPQRQYSTFKALWNSIAEAQQRDVEEDSEAGFIEDEQTDNDEELSAEDEGQTDDDDDDDEENSELWADAPESLDGSGN